MNSINKYQVWVNIVDSIRVLVLMVDDHYVYYQKDGFINHRFKYQFLEEFTFEHEQRAVQSSA